MAGKGAVKRLSTIRREYLADGDRLFAELVLDYWTARSEGRPEAFDLGMQLLPWLRPKAKTVVQVQAELEIVIGDGREGDG